MYRKTFFSSQLLRALLLVKVEDETDSARRKIVELLNKKRKVPETLDNSFIPGELRQTAVPDMKHPY